MPFRRIARCAWLAGLLSGACASAENKTPVVTPVDAGTRVHPIYRLGAATMRFGDIPWPDDNYLDANGNIAVRELPSMASADYSAALVSALGELDGFGLRPTVYIRFDGALDASSLPHTPEDSVAAGSSVFLIDADTSSPEAFQPIAVDLTYRAGDGELRLRPALYRALAPGRRYAVVVTDSVKALDGQAIAGADTFLRVRDPDTVLSEPRETAARALYAPVLATLAKRNVKREAVAALAVFHVQSAGSDLADARTLVRSQAPMAPLFTDALSGARLDEVLGTPPADARGLDKGGPHGHIGWMVHGTFSSPNLIAEKPGVHGHFEREPSNALRVKSVSDVNFTLFLPRIDKNSGAFPVAIVQHGLGRERSDALPLANALASSGYAVIAVDAPFHGMRSGQGDTHNRFTGEATPDGFGDAPGDFVGQADDGGDQIAFHPYNYRDAVRQGVVDLTALVASLQGSAWNASLVRINGLLSMANLNPTRLAVIGLDLGGEMGAMLATVEPSVGALVAAFSSGLALDDWSVSPKRKDLVDALVTRLGRDPSQLDWQADSPLLWPDVDAWRALTDRATAVAFATALRRAPTNVLVLMARDDEVVHNLGTEALAEPIGAEFLGGAPHYVPSLRAIDIAPQATLSANYPPEAGMVTRVLYQLDPATHDALIWAEDTQRYQPPFSPPFMLRATPKPVTNPLAQTLNQITFLLESLRSCEAPTRGVLPTCAASVQAQPALPK